MITRFSTLTDAVLFAARCGGDGRFAEVVHLNAGHLWGSQPEWGIAVVHSEEIGDEEAGEAPEVGWLPPGLNRAGTVVLTMALVVSVAVAVVMLLGAVSALTATPAGLVLLLSQLLQLAIGLVVIASTAVLGHLLIRAHRDPEPVLHRIIVGLSAGVGWVLVVLAF